jgi:hypothetical protein
MSNYRHHALARGRPPALTRARERQKKRSVGRHCRIYRHFCPLFPKKMAQTATYTHFEAQFATHDEVPPPYSYVYILQGPLAGPLVLNYQLRYPDREELTDEELADEGFSRDDDRDLTVEVAPVWQTELLALLEDTRSSRQPNVGRNEVLLKLTRSGGQVDEFYPQNSAEWEYLLQEVIQAALETAQLEAKLQLAFVALRQQLRHQWQVEVSFAQRRATVQYNQAPAKALPWMAAQDLMQLTFTPEYRADLAVEQIPAKPGFFINLGDGRWYEAGESAKNPSPKQDLLKRLEDILARVV